MPQQPKIVEVPGMGNVEFPGDMGDEDIGRIIAGQQSPARPDFAANPPGMPKAPNALQGVTGYGLLGPEKQFSDIIGGRPGAYEASSPLTPKEQLIQAGKSVGMGAAAAVPALFPPASILGRVLLSGAASGAETKLAGGTYGQAALAAGAGAGLQGAGEGVATLLSRIPAAAKFIPRLLNASGDVSPETLQNLSTAEPALRAGGVPAQTTQEGMAAHVRKLSTNIDSQIRPVIEGAAQKDVSASTAQIAQRLRAEITPEMRRVNPGTANMLEKIASSAEDTKTLGSLDELRKQLNDRRYAVKPNAIVRPYISRTLNEVLDTIADHAQQIRPDLPVRSMRSQQAALMKLGDTFEGSAAKGQAQLASRQGLTIPQKIGQKLPDLIQAATNPKAALAKKLVQPSTSEQLLQQAFKGVRPNAPVPIEVPFPEEQLNAIREGGAATRRSSAEFMQDVIRRQGLPADPQLADIEAAIKGRAAEMAQKYPVPQYQSLRDPFAPPPSPAEVYSPEVIQQHASAMEQAKSELGGNASLSEILQRAAKIQRGGQ